MLLDASEPITLSLPEAGVSLGPITSKGKHSCWWNLVERLSRFDRELRRSFLDQIRDQLGLSEEWARREIFESRGVLEKALGQTVWAFGYPFGNAATVTQRDLRLAEHAGFRCAF